MPRPRKPPGQESCPHPCVHDSCIPGCPIIAAIMGPCAFGARRPRPSGLHKSLCTSLARSGRSFLFTPSAFTKIAACGLYGLRPALRHRRAIFAPALFLLPCNGPNELRNLRRHCFPLWPFPWRVHENCIFADSGRQFSRPRPNRTRHAVSLLHFLSPRRLPAASSKGAPWLKLVSVCFRSSAGFEISNQMCYNVLH